MRIACWMSPNTFQDCKNREYEMTFLRMEELDLSNKRVLIREDLNVPIKMEMLPMTRVFKQHCQQ
ncbi:MAG: hypothetical protein CM1200mP40_18860 [Gammaproteobacteria bacterium]|nr:MAG: hypothetical protein CM1200mP40_18860 [Gammaproteobacteria bacterium]